MPLGLRRGVLPGFSLTLPLTLLYTGVFVLLPLSALWLKGASLSFADFRAAVLGPRALAAFGLSFSAALIAAMINAVFGLLLSWVLSRYRFAGKALLDACIDLPFALPTAVAGIALTTIYAQSGWIGRYLE